MRKLLVFTLAAAVALIGAGSFLVCAQRDARRAGDRNG